MNALMGPSQTEEQVWWVVEVPGLIGGASVVRVSDLIPDGSMLREMRIRVKPESAAALAYDVYVMVGLVSALTPSDADIVAMPRLIWFWDPLDPEGKWASFVPDAEEEWLLAQKVEGSGSRLCAAIMSKGTDTARVRVGVRYRAGRS